MKNNEILLSALGQVKDKFIPLSPASADNENSKNNENIREDYAEMQIVTPQKSRKKWAALSGGCAAVVAGALVLNGLHQSAVQQSTLNEGTRSEEIISALNEGEQLEEIISDYRIYSENIWETKTEDLPLITSALNLSEFYGGYEIINDPSELDSGTPWREDMQLDTMPVFLHWTYIENGTELNDFPVCYTKEQMTEMGDKIADILDLTVKDSEFAYTDCCANTSISMYLYSLLLFCESDKYRDYESLEAVVPVPETQINVVIYGDGTVSIRLPDACKYPRSEFEPLLQYQNPVYSEDELGQYTVYEKGDSAQEDILNFTFARSAVGQNSIKLNNLLYASEYMGDYPIITAEEARTRFLQGDYITNVPEEFIIGQEEADFEILKTELVYNTANNIDKYLQPYYLIYAAIKRAPDMTYNSESSTVYGEFYVPAVSPEYRTAEAADFYPLDLLNYYIDSDGFYRVDQDTLKPTEDYELFRKYFFGAWEGSFSLPSAFEQDGLIIDDSLKSYIMTDIDVRLAGFYEVNGHVLAFINGSSGGSSIHWLDTDDPDTMYIAWGGVGEHNHFWSTNEDGSPAACPTVYSLTKTDDLPNQPEENFLSIYKLHEMSRDYGIDFDMLVSIEYENEDGTERLWHDDWAQFYPVYLVSEAPDKLVLKTTVGNVYSPDEEAEAVYIIEKIDGEWVRTVEIDDEAGVR